MNKQFWFLRSGFGSFAEGGTFTGVGSLLRRRGWWSFSSVRAVDVAVAHCRSSSAFDGPFSGCYRRRASSTCLEAVTWPFLGPWQFRLPICFQWKKMHCKSVHISQTFESSRFRRNRGLIIVVYTQYKLLEGEKKSTFRGVDTVPLYECQEIECALLFWVLTGFAPFSPETGATRIRVILVLTIWPPLNLSGGVWVGISWTGAQSRFDCTKWWAWGIFSRDRREIFGNKFDLLCVCFSRRGFCRIFLPYGSLFERPRQESYSDLAWFLSVVLVTPSQRRALGMERTVLVWIGVWIPWDLGTITAISLIPVCTVYGMRLKKEVNVGTDKAALYFSIDNILTSCKAKEDVA